MSDAHSFWSPSTRGFYHEHLHGAREVEVAPAKRKTAPPVRAPNPATKIPPDALPLTLGEHDALMAGQAKGQEVIAGPDGRPALADPAPPELDFDHARRAAYGPLRVQLEMIYRDLKAAGIEGEFTRHIEAVKAAVPKSEA